MKKKKKTIITTDDRLEGTREWPEARIVQMPVRDPQQPLILVKRNIPELVGLHGEELIFLPGEPTISLFTGAGGFDIGTETENAGFCTVVQHEWDKTCCETLICNRPGFFPHSALIQGDIFKTPTSMILEAGGLRVGEAGLLTGGPPCQGFSTSGKRDPKDKRNTLIGQYVRVVREAQPKFFCMENVPGFLSLDGGRFFEDFLRTAYDAYYDLVYGLLDAANYGVPQHRTRFICMGTRRDLSEIDGLIAGLPRMTNFAPEDLKLIMPPDAPLFPPERRADRAPVPGIRYFPDRPILVPPRPTGGLDVRITNAYVEFYEHLARTEPDRLVVTDE